jgi:hypothetical protein
MHYRHNTGPRENGKPLLHKIRNQPKKPAHHTGCGRPANSTNQKTIGINKLGTLLSSQTTGTTGTKNPEKPGPHRSGATLQAYPHQTIPANPLPRTTTGQTGTSTTEPTRNNRHQTKTTPDPCTAHTRKASEICVGFAALTGATP